MFREFQRAGYRVVRRWQGDGLFGVDAWQDRRRRLKGQSQADREMRVGQCHRISLAQHRVGELVHVGDLPERCGDLVADQFLNCRHVRLDRDERGQFVLQCE